MTELQEQADAAMRGGDGDLQSQRAHEDSLIDSKQENQEDQVEYADEGGADDYPAPSPIEDDGSGFKSDATGEFADDSTAPQLGSDAEVTGPSQGTRQTQRKDIHAPAERPTGQGDEFTPALLNRARSYGLNAQAAMRQFQTPDALEDALLSYDQRALQYMHMQASRPQAPPMQQAPVQQPPQRQQQQQQQAPAEPQLYKMQYEDRLDDEMVEDLNGMQKHLLQQVQQQSQQVQQVQYWLTQQQRAYQQLVAQQQAERDQRETEDFDQTISSLGGEWNEVFGDSDMNDLAADSPQQTARIRAYQTAKQLQWAHAQQGRRVKLVDVLPSSLSVQFPERQRVAATPGGRRRSRGSGYLARPGRRQGGVRGSNGREAKLQEWDKFYREHGLGVDAGEDGGLAEY